MPLTKNPSNIDNFLFASGRMKMYRVGLAGSYTKVTGTGGVASIGLTNSNGSHSHTTDSTGSSGTNANLQPYIVVRMWKRTV